MAATTAGAGRPVALPKATPQVVVEPAWVDLGVALVLIGGVILRFATTSPLWLDETLSVNIAALPLSEIPEALRHDGAPPLYYVLLKGWMSIFGASDFAVRALSGVIAMATLPLMWLAGRRIGGREGAWTATVLLASSPFAMRYATEARMYALVVLLCLAGFLALDGFLDRPTTPRLAGLMLIAGAMVLTHYWSVYLIGAVLFGLALRSDRTRRRASRNVKTGPLVARDSRFAPSWAIVGLGVGLLALMPWLPSLLFQLRNTGTPWGDPPGASAPVNALLSFGGGGGAGDAATLLGLLLVLMAILGTLGRRLDPRIDKGLVLLDLRGSTPGRGLALIVGAALVAAAGVGMVTGSAFQPRYASVVLPPFLLLVTVGAAAIASVKVRRAIVAIAVGLGLIVGTTGVSLARTQAGDIASVIAVDARPGDVVLYCPDQLGPAAQRELDQAGVGGRLRQVTYPNLESPERVDWVNYLERHRNANPEKVAQRVHALAAGFTIWMVWSPAYRNLNGGCGELNAHLNNVRPQWENLVTFNARRGPEPSNLTIYPPG